MKKQILYIVLMTLALQAIVIGGIILMSSNFEIRADPFGSIILKDK